MPYAKYRCAMVQPLVHVDSRNLCQFLQDVALEVLAMDGEAESLELKEKVH